jgi:uncharacterized protein (DUF2249 family)
MDIGITGTPAPRPAPIEPADSKEDFLARFDALAAGESFSFETDEDPGARLAVLRARRPGKFEWSPDLEGPARWRTTVTRRGSGQARTVSDALAWDHDRLDALERDAFAARDRGDRLEAVRLFDEFARGLERHIAFEEAILFPAFEEKTGHPPAAGPTAVMREEHRVIRSLLAEIAAELRDPSASPVDRRRSLGWILGEHNAKEEQILYPMTDAALGPDGADALVGRIQSFRQPAD